MSRLRIDSNLPEIESLLAVERELVPESDELRQRVMLRARTSLPRTLRLPFSAVQPRSRRIQIGAAAAVAVLLSGLCAAAFYAGYRMKSDDASGDKAAAVAASTESTLLPSASVVVALVPVNTPMSPQPANADPMLPDAGAVRTKAAGSARSPVDIEAYALELQVLQAARRGVARGDFVGALGAIAEHQRRFTAGKLAEEREALRVKALLGLGRSAEAERAGSAFRARFPRSALLGRIDEMLGTRK